MEPVVVRKLARLRQRMVSLLEQVEASTHLTVKRTVCAPYYLQKVRELELLVNHFPHAESVLGVGHICSFYTDAFYHWRQDVRWFQKFLRTRAIL